MRRAQGLCAAFLLVAMPAVGQSARPDSARAAARGGGGEPASDSLAPPRIRLPELRARVPLESPLLTRHGLDRESLGLGGMSLGEALRELPGLQVRGRGGGGPELASIRGSRPEDVRVTLDGIPLDDPLTGAADLSAIPAASIQTAVVAPGAGGGPGWGGTAGTLALESRVPEPGVEARALAGSHGRLATDLALGFAPAFGDVGIYARAEGARNDYLFHNRILPERPLERRRNADREARNVVARIALAPAPITLVGRFDEVGRGAAGRMGNHVWDEARWDERSRSLGASWSFPDGSRIGLAWSERTQLYRDPRTERREALEARHWIGTGRVVLGSRTKLEWEGSRAMIRGDRFAAARERWTGGIRALRTDPISPPLSLTWGLGAHAAAEGVALSPAASLKASAAGRWTAWIRASQARRLPTFADRFLRPGTGAAPNPELRPERVALDAELGVEARGPELVVSTALFLRRTRDPIVWLPSVVGVWSPRNLGRLSAAGLEVRADWRPGPSWRLGVSGTWQSSRLRFEDGSDTSLPYEPGLSGSVLARFVGATRELRASLDVVGGRRTNVFSLHTLPAYALLNLRGRQTFLMGKVRAEVHFGVVNALGSTYERIELFPEPGRRFELGVSLGTGGLPRPSATRSLPPVPTAPPEAPADGEHAHGRDGASREESRT